MSRSANTPSPTPHNTPGQAPTPERIMQMAFAYAPPLIIGAAVRHGYFDTLDAGAKTAEELAAATKTSVRGARAILDALVSLEFLSKDGRGRYALTPESAAFLVSTRPGFHGGIFKHIGTQLLPKWLEIDEIVRTGEPAQRVNDRDNGAAFFAQFVEDIFPMSYAAASVLGDALRLAEARDEVRVLDIAAGSGVWGIALAQKGPRVRVTALDWPGVLDVTKRIVGRFGLDDRFNYIAGDLLEADYGGPYDVITLGHILHSEGEARSRALLRRCAAALKPGGTVAIAEFLVNADRTGPANGTIFAVNMLVNTKEGDTFSFEEIRGWLEEAGFGDARLLEAPGPSPLVLATKR